jgi:hypothetical protein
MVGADERLENIVMQKADCDKPYDRPWEIERDC